MAQIEPKDIRFRFATMAQFEPKSLAQYNRNHWHKSNRGIQTYPISSNFSIMIESYFILEDGLEGFIMPTLRYNYNHITIDLGFVNTSSFDDDVRIPLLAVSTLF